MVEPIKGNRLRVLSIVFALCIATGLVGAIASLFDSRGLVLLIFGGLGCLATLNTVLFINLRKHIDILHRAVLATQAAVSLSRVNLDYPTFFINHAVAPDFLQIMAEILRRNPISSVLELGSGTSSLYISALLNQYRSSGRVISLEDSKEWAVLVQHELDMIGITNVEARVIHAPLILDQETSIKFYDVPMSAVSQISPVDLIVVDGPGDARLRLAVFKTLGNLFSDSTILLFDDGDNQHIQQGIQEWIRANPSWAARKYATVKGTCVVWNHEKHISLPLP